MKSIAFVVPWAGHLPPYFQLWLESCRWNSSIDFLLFTDDQTNYNYPNNVKVHYMSFEQMKELFQKQYDFPLSINVPYKFCDFKPAYGEIFSDYLKGYDYWGHCDVDLIWGGIRKFITDDILMKYKRIFSRGHCSIYQNLPEVNSLYRTLPACSLSAVLLCFLYLYAYHPVNPGRGLKNAAKTWIEEFKTSLSFRKLFLLFFFTVMILFRTLLNRNMWLNPLSDVMGGWWIWEEVNGEQQLTTECFENLILMIPFTFLLFWTFEDKIKQLSLWGIIWKGLKIAFIFSFTIEMLQLFLRLGTWQLSDLFYNTMGGGIGGFLYYIVYRVKRNSGR